MRYEDLLLKIVMDDERYMVLTAENRAAIRRLPEFLGRRFIDTGITEQALLGIAAGMALRGRIPVVHGLSAFLTMRAFEFIRTDAGVASLPIKLVGSLPGFLSTANGPAHQAVEDVALMRCIPSMHIFCPADEQDLTLGLPHVLESPNPCYIRLNQLPPVKEHLHSFAIGHSEIISEGSDVVILVYGTGKPLIVSTGMSTMQEIQATFGACGTENLLIAHTTSAYPCKTEELNLRTIHTLRDLYPDVPIGYSGHEVGLATTWAAVALGACFVERHITLDRSMWGSDQSASIEIMGAHRLVRDIREIEKALGDGIKKVYDSEQGSLKKLRRVMEAVS